MGLLLAVVACSATERFVNVNSLHAVSPYTNWTHAAAEIQQAIDVADVGDVIWVTNGVYQTGGRLVFGSATNRIAVTKALTLRSVNGPESTIILGRRSFDWDVVRCAYLTNGAAMVGFTLAEGGTSAWGYGEADQSGGGVWCEGASVILSNCVVVNNTGFSRGGGVYRGTLYGCSVSNNTAYAGGGVYETTVFDSLIASNSATEFGGGADNSQLQACVVENNFANRGGGVIRSGISNSVVRGNLGGGGAWESTLVNCAVSNNFSGEGGGISFSTALNCVIRDNRGGMGGGASVSTLTGCLLAGNQAMYGAGGAAYGRLTNCVVSRNSGSGGGGTANSIVVNSALFLNSADYGGGSLGDTLFNCTVTGNVAREEGGGGYASSFNNCVVYYNQSPTGSNYTFHDYFGGTLNFCCTTPMPVHGTNNFTDDPLLASPRHLSLDSPCRGAGSPLFTIGLDLDGDAWRNPPAVGCDEVRLDTVGGSISATILASFTNAAKGYSINLNGAIDGHATQSWWDFGDGQTVSNRPYTTHSWAMAGDYPVVLWVRNKTYPDGISFTQMVHVTEGEHFVTLSSTNPIAPYTNWATAAAGIQDALDAASAGATVFVGDGIYRSGARVVSGTLSNRVVVIRPITLRSLNGPEATIIEGNPAIGDQAVRCVYLTNGSALIGFTLTNGATAALGDPDSQQSGGAFWCLSTNVIVTNCILAGNFAANQGGGAMRGTVLHSSLSNNTANFGGASCLTVLEDCLLVGNRATNDAGAAYASALSRCYFYSNSAGVHGGGASSSTLNSCALVGNRAGQNGGAVAASTLTNCTLMGNAGRSGGGANACTLYNCIVFYNTDDQTGNYWNCTLNYCDTQPLPESGTNNITDEPQLDSTLHLGDSSPCRGRGGPLFAGASDIDGDSFGQPPSVGCNEYLAGSAVGPISVKIVSDVTNAMPGIILPFTAQVEGRVTEIRWDFGDGNVLSNRRSVSHAWAATGDYVLELRAYNDEFPGGIAATAIVHIVVDRPTYFVSLTSTNPIPPYDSWITAATNIQDAVDVAPVAGARILVGDGVYHTGGRVLAGGLSNRVAVTKALHLQSLNGPLLTMIRGVPNLGSNAVRCVWMTNQCSITGFTLAEGGTQAVGDDELTRSGGGVWSSETNLPVVNCIFISNNAAFRGGGIYRGSLSNCTLSFNQAAYGGGGYAVGMISSSVFSNVALADGGGVYLANLNNSLLRGNSSKGLGGGGSIAQLENCLVSSNFAGWAGGGLHTGSASNCYFIGNRAVGGGGGCHSADAWRCVITANIAPGAGGASGGRLWFCDISSNRPPSSSIYNNAAVVGAYVDHCRVSANWGGGISGGSVIKNSLIVGNSGDYGGVDRSSLENCTVFFNARYDEVGGVYGGTARNCIIYLNFKAPNQLGFEFADCDMSYCCSSVLAPGLGNFTNAPLFLNPDGRDTGDYRLQSNSPCINAGRNGDATTETDLDGNPRVIGGTVDVGAYEYLTPSSTISYAWLQQYGLPETAEADYLDSDGDGMNNWQEWRAATIPTNRESLLRMLSPSNHAAGLTLSWLSETGVSYALERGSSLGPESAYVTLVSNVAGNVGATSYVDTNSTVSSKFFYRVQVQ